MNPAHCLLFVLALWLSACQFEGGDDPYVPETVASYLLLRDSTTGHNRLLRYAQGAEQRDWQEEVGLPAEQLGGLSGREGEVFLGSNQPGRLLRLDGRSGQLAQTYPLDSLRSHYVMAGERVLMVCDTVAQAVGLLGLDDEGLVVLPVNATPGQPAYRGGQFYVPVGGEVWVYQAEARALLAQVALPRRLTHLQPDWRSTVWTYWQQGDTLWKAGIEYHNHLITDPPEPLPSVALELYSPYRQVNYGSERTQAIRLNRNGRFADQRNVRDLRYDFFAQTAFFLRQDTLYRQGRGEAPLALWPGRTFDLLADHHHQGRPSGE